MMIYLLSLVKLFRLHDYHNFNVKSLLGNRGSYTFVHIIIDYSDYVLIMIYYLKNDFPHCSI